MNMLLANIQNSIGVDSISLLIAILTFLAFVMVWAIYRINLLRIHKNAEHTKDLHTIMRRTLDTGKNYVLKLSIQDRYAVNMYGDFLPQNGMSYQECLNYIHPEDVIIYQEFLASLIHGQKTAECTVRWDRSGEKHQGDWQYMHDTGIAEYTENHKTPQYIFCTLTDRTEEMLREQKEQILTDRYRQFFGQKIAGLAFYDKDGHLLYVNKKMRDILKFQSKDDPYYFSHTLYDLPTFRNVLTERKAEELYFCTKSMIVERGVNCYTELRVHPINDENGELTYITFSIRDITQERELYLQNKQKDLEIRRANENIQQYETELKYLMETCNMRFFRISVAEGCCTFYKTQAQPEKKIAIDKLESYFVDDAFKDGLQRYQEYFNEPRAILTQIHPFFGDSDELQWNYIDSVPYFDKHGKMAGTYGIVRNVNELMEKQERLKQETERANQSGLMKSTFMANMTHEIRTPLNAIVGFSDVLSMLPSSEEKQEIVKVIMNNCDMLLRLVNDILAISSLGDGGIDFKPDKVDFAKEFDSICTSLEQRVQNPNVAFIKDNPLEHFFIEIDNGRTQQVITNFVTNAVKYTQKGHIKVGYKPQERDGKSGIYIYCEDTGAGISQKDQGKVFDRFVKLNDFIQGTGLGLSICKAIADGCHGQIGLFSEGEGKGSTFWIWIPCERYDS